MHKNLRPKVDHTEAQGQENCRPKISASNPPHLPPAHTSIHSRTARSYSRSKPGKPSFGHGRRLRKDWGSKTIRFWFGTPISSSCLDRCNWKARPQEAQARSVSCFFMHKSEWNTSLLCAVTECYRIWQSPKLKRKKNTMTRATTADTVEGTKKRKCCSGAMEEPYY